MYIYSVFSYIDNGERESERERERDVKGPDIKYNIHEKRPIYMKRDLYIYEKRDAKRPNIKYNDTCVV